LQAIGISLARSRSTTRL